MGKAQEQKLQKAAEAAKSYCAYINDEVKALKEYIKQKNEDGFRSQQKKGGIQCLNGYDKETDNLVAFYTTRPKKNCDCEYFLNPPEWSENRRYGEKDTTC